MPATPIEDEALDCVIGGAQVIAAFPDVCFTPPETGLRTRSIQKAGSGADAEIDRNNR